MVNAIVENVVCFMLFHCHVATLNQHLQQWRSPFWVPHPLRLIHMMYDVYIYIQGI
jgi:hypothetical protein